MKIDTLKPIVDALIFASEMPLSATRIRQIIQEAGHEDIAPSAIQAAIEKLKADNRDSQRGFYLQEVAGGYQYRTRPNYAAWIKKLKKAKAFRLTQSTLETLAIIAYKQPIIRTDIEKLRGVDSGGVIKNLIERSLIRIVGRKNIPGRPFMFGTTRRFLEVFGLDRLEDLPSLKEFEGLDESMLPTILRQKIPPELFDAESRDGDGNGTVNDSEPVTDEQLSAADQAAEQLAADADAEEVIQASAQTGEADGDTAAGADSDTSCVREENKEQ